MACAWQAVARSSVYERRMSAQRARPVSAKSAVLTPSTLSFSSRMSISVVQWSSRGVGEGAGEGVEGRRTSALAEAADCSVMLAEPAAP